jgi:hypothetical protein
VIYKKKKKDKLGICFHQVATIFKNFPKLSMAPLQHRSSSPGHRVTLEVIWSQNSPFVSAVIKLGELSEHQPRYSCLSLGCYWGVYGLWMPTHHGHLSSFISPAFLY